jgi:hypothetical protein
MNSLIGSQKLPHPSTRLYRGEVTDFREAMRLYQQQMRHENSLTEQLAAQYQDPITEQERALMKRLNLAANDAGEALKIYAEHVQEAEKKVIAALRAKGTDTFNDFAEALESGNYSQLAI